MNRLSLSLAACPRQTVLLECAVCRQPIDPEDQTETQVNLFGAVDYAVCCGCGQAVDAHRDRAYRQRYGKHFRRRAAARSVKRGESPI